MKAIHTTHVVYIAKAINFASLKFSGILRVLKAYKVHITIRTIAYTNDNTKDMSVTAHSKMTWYQKGKVFAGLGGSIANHRAAATSCTDTSPKQITICDLGLVYFGLLTERLPLLKILYTLFVFV